MRKVQNILFVSHGMSDITQSLKQALHFAQDVGAQIKILIVSPTLPSNFSVQEETYRQSLIERMHKTLETSREVELAADVAIEVEYSDMPANSIIRHVLRHGYDMVMKAAQLRDEGKGFKAMDMDLLRKCPAPVWLCLPAAHTHRELRVAVAIDPVSEQAVSRDLSIRMLQLARSIADRCSGDLHVVSCWDYKMEEYVRGNVWLKVSDEELEEQIRLVEAEHRIALDKLITESGITGSVHVLHERGKAENTIPKVMSQIEADLLVMGTVARTGIPGFVIGNTAENTLQKLHCSLLALKPEGFVSPVKAY